MTVAHLAVFRRHGVLTRLALELSRHRQIARTSAWQTAGLALDQAFRDLIPFA